MLGDLRPDGKAAGILLEVAPRSRPVLVHALRERAGALGYEAVSARPRATVTPASIADLREQTTELVKVTPASVMENSALSPAGPQ